MRYALEESSVPAPPLDCSRPGTLLLVHRADPEWFVDHEERYICRACAPEARAHLAEGRNWYDDGAAVTLDPRGRT